MHSILAVRKQRSRGIALIEALVGILIFSFGVMGLMGLQASMTKAQAQSRVRSDASNLASEILGTIQADAIANLGSYDSANCAGYPLCSEWANRVAATLPSGQGAVAVDPNTGMVSVSITWQQGGDSSSVYTTSTQWP